MASLPINPFDAAIYLLVIVAVIAGFHSGLLRSVATILGYVAAMPVALALAPRVAVGLNEQMQMPQMQMPQVRTLVMFFAIFLVAGIALSALLRLAVSETVGTRISIPDRLAGSALGAVRIGLLAVLMVVIFDRIIPSDREPPFLAGSRLRPILSIAGAQGLKSLPPDVADYIDQLKRERGI
jgi:membrane protein required for colicin V production